MLHIDLIQRVLWLVIIGLQVAILLIMTGRRLYRNFPAVYCYLLIGLAQSPLMYFVYQAKGYESWAAYWTAWVSQGVVVLARWTAVCELCYTILGPFRGVWALTWRVLAVIGATALSVAVIFGGHDYTRLINTFDLGLEFSIATVLVAFFAFTRFYDIGVSPALRSMGIAFCMYSCLRAFNDTVLQTFLRNYVKTWGVVDGVTYVSTLTLICAAVYVYQAQPAQTVNLLPSGTYAAFVPQANERLIALNEHLSRILKGPTGGKV